MDYSLVVSCKAKHSFSLSSISHEILCIYFTDFKTYVHSKIFCVEEIQINYADFPSLILSGTYRLPSKEYRMKRENETVTVPLKNLQTLSQPAGQSLHPML